LKLTSKQLKNQWFLTKSLYFVLKGILEKESLFLSQINKSELQEIKLNGWDIVFKRLILLHSKRLKTIV